MNGFSFRDDMYIHTYHVHGIRMCYVHIDHHRGIGIYEYVLWTLMDFYGIHSVVSSNNGVFDRNVTFTRQFRETIPTVQSTEMMALNYRVHQIAAAFHSFILIA